MRETARSVEVDLKLEVESETGNPVLLLHYLAANPLNSTRLHRRRFIYHLARSLEGRLADRDRRELGLEGEQASKANGPHFERRHPGRSEETNSFGG